MQQSPERPLARLVIRQAFIFGTRADPRPCFWPGLLSAALKFLVMSWDPESLIAGQLRRLKRVTKANGPTYVYRRVLGQLIR